MKKRGAGQGSGGAGRTGSFTVDGLTIPIASLADLGDMSRLFGRAKAREQLVLIETFKRRGHENGQE